MDRTLPQLLEVESPARKEPSALGRVGEALGLEVEDGREYGDGWKEFRKGEFQLSLVEYDECEVLTRPPYEACTRIPYRSPFRRTPRRR